MGTNVKVSYVQKTQGQMGSLNKRALVYVQIYQSCDQYSSSGLLSLSNPVRLLVAFYMAVCVC